VTGFGIGAEQGARAGVAEHRGEPGRQPRRRALEDRVRERGRAATGREPAQHRVGEAAHARPAQGRHGVDGGGDRGVRRHPVEEEELVRRERELDPDPRVATGDPRGASAARRASSAGPVRRQP
jgi:hypothetical protein